LLKRLKLAGTGGDGDLGGQALDGGRSEAVVRPRTRLRISATSLGSAMGPPWQSTRMSLRSALLSGNDSLDEGRSFFQRHGRTLANCIHIGIQSALINRDELLANPKPTIPILTFSLAIVLSFLFHRSVAVPMLP
jgi:hypothetical protein